MRDNAANTRPTRQGIGGRRYIGPKAQSTVDERFWARVDLEAQDRECPMSDVWREVIYAGLVATKRATQSEVVELGGDL